VLLTIVGIGLYLLGAAQYLLPSVPFETARNVWFVLLISSAVGIPIAIAQRIFFALQMGTAGQIWATAGRASVVIGAFAAGHAAPNLEAFVLAFVLLPNVVAAASLMYLFIRLRPDLRPSVSGLSLERLGPRVSTGLNFTLNHLVNFAEFGGDTILISQFYGPQTVAQYDLLSRLFGYVIALVGLGMWPIWPAISTAVAQHDYGWVLTARRTGYWFVTVVSSCAALFLWFGSDTVIRLWTGVHIGLPETTVLYSALAIFVILYNLINFQQVFLIAFNDITRQSVVSMASISVTLPLKYVLLSNGVFAGVVIAAFGMFVVKLVYYDSVVRRHIQSFARKLVTA
jgi:O-antigen/teichoic acid export membrane protein